MAHGVDLAGQPTMWDIDEGKSYLCNPGCAIGAFESSIHHITDADVAGQPHWESMCSVVIGLGSKKADIYAGHGIKTELDFLGQWTGSTAWIDTWKCALHVYPDAPAHSNQVLKYWVKSDGVMNPALSLPAHRAGPDAFVTAHLLRDMLNFHASLDQLLKWSTDPALLRWCRIGKWRQMNGGRGTRWEEVDTGFLNWMLDPSRTFSDDEVYTARHHLEKREFDQREERERLALERQFQDNGLSDAPAEPGKDIANDNKDLFTL